MSGKVATSPGRVDAPDARRWSVRSLLVPEFAIVPVLAVVIVVGAFLSPAFLSYDNLYGIMQQFAELSILVIALSMILIVGKFDLSLESTFGLAPMVGVFLFLSSPGTLGLFDAPILAMVCALVVGAVIGAINGTLVVYLKFNAFIVTLAMLIFLRGIDLGLTRGQTISSLPEAMTYLGQASFAGLPVSFLLAAAILILSTVFLSRFRAGRALYAIGGNSQAARVAGIRVEKVVFTVFIVGGVLAALAGLLQAGRIQSVPTAMGQNLIFNAFAAAVLGGVSLNGGRGTMFGAAGGVLLLILIQNLLILSQVPSYWISATTGAIIIIALFIARLSGGEKAT